MFSATKFVVAGAIVALFGGFLLSGVLTQPSEESVPAVGASASATAQADPTVDATSESEPAPESNKTEEGAETTRPGLQGAFRPTGTLKEGRSRHTVTLLRDGRVLVVGGTGAQGAFASAEIWDPATETFSPAGETAMRSGHSAVLLPDGRVLIVGGYGSDGDLHQAEVWDPETESFSPAGSLIEWRSGWSSSTTLLPDGRVFVVGGGNDHRRGASALAEVWDPETVTFSSAGEMAEARVSQTATVLPDGRVLVAGGMVPNILEKSAASAEVWDPATASFSPAGSLLEGRDGHTATRLSDGRVLVIGGDRGRNDWARSAEIWDPATASFSPAGSLVEGRYKHTATLLPDGRVLVIGGNGGDPSTAEIWDPATASFSPAGSLDEDRWASNATLLPDGRVLVIGGADSDNVPIASAEVWSPATAEPPAEAATTTILGLLPGVDVVTEEVEPGVSRVVSDGVRDLTTNVHDVTVRTDGSVWVMRGGGANQRVIRLGEPGVALTDRIHDLGHTGAGKPLVRRSNQYQVLDGGVWVDYEPTFCDLDTFWGGPIGPPLHGGITASGECLVEAPEGIDRLPDGSRNGMGEPLTNTELGLPDGDQAWGIAFAEDGTTWTSVWVSLDGPLRIFDGLLRHDGTSWTHVPYEPAVSALAPTGLRQGGVAVGPDGMIWVGSQGPNGFFSATSWDGETWNSYGPILGGGYGGTHFLDDGTIWFLDGSVVFDGERLRTTDLPVSADASRSTRPVFAPNGKAWMVVHRDDDLPSGLYVITPEAVAAAE